MLKKILIIIQIIVTIGILTLMYSTIGTFVKGSMQPKIVSTDGHVTFSWGFYTVGIVMASITCFVILLDIIYIIIARKKYLKLKKN